MTSQVKSPPSNRGEKHFNIGYDATWGDDKDGENDWLSSALAQRLA